MTPPIASILAALPLILASFVDSLPLQVPLFNNTPPNWRPLISSSSSATSFKDGCNVPKRDSDLNETRCPNFCAGTKATNRTADHTYVCDDARLGPVKLPFELPIDGIQGLDSGYRRFGGLCPGEFLAQYFNDTTNEYIYPPFSGYSLVTAGTKATSNITLRKGTLLDRFGDEYGCYMSAAGTPYAMRSLPPSKLNAEIGSAFPFNYRVYTVTDNFVAEAGPILGWFGQQGLGLQFKLSTNVKTLVEDGHLTPVNLTANRDY